MTEHEMTHSGASHAHDHHDDSAVIFGRRLPMPVYTAVYIALAILTITEVLLFELPRGWLTIPSMIIIAIIKAGLVVWFYMHLNKDTRLFAVILLVPTFLVIVCTIFLMLVPVGY